ncbi:MAG: GNAT family N-acetyltransferase [Bryocella sp.]
MAPELRLGNVVMIGRENLGSVATVAVERSVLNEQNYAYREALLGKDLLFAAIDDDGQVLTYGFVLFDSFYKRVLGEAVEVPMIGNCFTFPSFRRRGLYARLLVSIGDYLASAGHERAIITCAPDNLASVRGIQNAGFSRIKTLRSVVLFSRWVVFQSSLP